MMTFLARKLFEWNFLFVGNIESIPLLLENVIDHFIQWKLIPEYKRPNGCIINFFEEVFYVTCISLKIKESGITFYFFQFLSIYFLFFFFFGRMNIRNRSLNRPIWINPSLLCSYLNQQWPLAVPL